MLDQIVRGPLLVPIEGGDVAYYSDGVLAADDRGVLQFVGSWQALAGKVSADGPRVRQADGVMLPPLLDLHIHIPQHPIRGDFTKGVPADSPDGTLLEGLRRNIYPAEIACNNADVCRRVVEQFKADTLAHGVIGGAAYMTPSASATEIALTILPATWSVGLVLMNRDCPPDLQTNQIALEADVVRLADRFGRRLIITDRFAVAVDSSLRHRAAELAKRFGLRTQTHLNEQKAEKELVEKNLYPEAESYADVYRRDGLLDCDCICAHCVHMRQVEWSTLLATGAAIAHCPTSNLTLNSGLMPLDEVIGRKIPYAIATDVGASPTVSVLAEIGRFLHVHKDHSAHATPAEGLYRTTLAPADILGLRDHLGHLEPGRPMSFIEVRPDSQACANVASDTVDAAIRAILPANLDKPQKSVCRVTVGGRILSNAT